MTLFFFCCKKSEMKIYGISGLKTPPNKKLTIE